LPSKDAESIAKWYDALSKNYDELYGEEQSKKHAAVLHLLGNKEFKIMVDVGCGTGRLLGLIASKARVELGIDLSLQMLIRARRSSADPSIHLVRAEASHLPLQDQIADGVTSVSMTESGPISTEHFNELLRITTKEGTLVITIFDDRNKSAWKELSQTKMELIASFKNRERLYLLDRTKYRARASS
jgi:ubiquinone/menaquinone biosynthesis C-methylase UbiE